MGASQTCFVVGPRALWCGARGGGLVDVAGGPRAREAERAKGSVVSVAADVEDGRAWCGYAAWLLWPGAASADSAAI